MKYNRNSYEANLGFGTREQLYHDVVTLTINMRDTRNYRIAKTALIECGIAVGESALAEMRFNKGGKEGLHAVTESALRTRTPHFVSIDAPDAVSTRLVKMLTDLGYPHSEYYVLSFEMSASGEHAGILFVESKPKKN